jgi:uncharacterized protein (TIGR03790 family)
VQYDHSANLKQNTALQDYKRTAVSIRDPRNAQSGQGAKKVGQLACYSARSFAAGIALVCLLLCGTSGALASGAPRNVLVVENTLSPTSRDIADYYSAARGIPICNRCRIRCSTSEVVSRAECETNVLAPILNALQNPAISDQIDYIVLTKGVPLAANYGYSTGPLSITSILTCIGEPVTEYMDNPYGPSSGIEVAFSHQLNLSGYHLYLVTRLDAYTVQEVYAMIDRSVAPSPLGPILLDRAVPPLNAKINDRLTTANNLLILKGIPTIYDNTTTFLGGRTGLMGYFSWGSNDGSYNHAAYASNTFVPGSIADTFVSSSGRTFNPTSGGQSLVADLITQGACGVCGYVSEPYVAYATYPNVLFDRYTKGYNLAESFYAACPLLFWKSVVIGDPLMAPYATIPQVTAESPSSPLTGLAQMTAEATDPDGIARVDFYLDGVAVGSATTPPYSVAVDTTAYPVGSHTLSVMAVEASPVASEGWASASVDIVNPVSALRVIADAFVCADQQGVNCSGQVVTASTADMGGSEFYVQETNGTSGMRVLWSKPVSEGDVVTISGKLVTDTGERSIQADMVQVDNQLLTPLVPVGLPNRMVGGGSFAKTNGVTGGTGLRNIGLLVTTWGKTTYIGGAGEDFFYVDDGSRLKDGSGHVGLKVKSRSLLKPALGVFVRVTGISSCEELGGKTIPVVKLRKQTDVT